MLAGLSAVAEAIADDQQFSKWTVDERGDGYVTIRNGDVVLTLAAHELWSVSATIRPHWVRARSGNYTLILLGSDEELEAGASDAVGDEFTASGLITLPVSATRLGLHLEGLYRVHGFRLELAKPRARSRAGAIRTRPSYRSRPLALPGARHDRFAPRDFEQGA